MTPNDDLPGVDRVAQLRSVLAETVAGSLRLASRLNALVWEPASAMQPSGAGRPDTPEPLSRWLGWQLSMFSTVATQAAAALEGVFSAATRSGMPAPEPPTATVRLEAQPGRFVAISFLVENQYDRCVDVSFTADPLVSSAAGSVSPEVISFDPPIMALAPGERLVARASIQVSEQFAVGETYSTALRVLQLPAPPLHVEIAVVPRQSG